MGPRFRRNFNEKLKDRDDISLEVKSQKSAGSAKGFLRVWLSCLVGICPAKIATTKSKPDQRAERWLGSIDDLERDRATKRHRRGETAREETKGWPTCT